MLSCASPSLLARAWLLKVQGKRSICLRVSRTRDNWGLGMPRVPLLAPWMDNVLFRRERCFMASTFATPDSYLMVVTGWGLDGRPTLSVIDSCVSLQPFVLGKRSTLRLVPWGGSLAVPMFARTVQPTVRGTPIFRVKSCDDRPVIRPTKSHPQRSSRPCLQLLLTLDIRPVRLIPVRVQVSPGLLPLFPQRLVVG